MAIDFPNSPTSGDLYTAGGKTWQWNGTFWSAYGTSPVYRVSDTPPIGPSTGDTWYESDTGRLYIYTDSYWVEIGSAGRVTVSANDLTGPTLASNVVSSSLTSVGTLGSLTVTGATTSGSFVQGTDYLSPYQGSRNVIINGDMRIAQRGTSTASITTGGYYTCDRWQSGIVSAGTWTQTQSTDAPAGFGNSLKMQCTTASASPILAYIQSNLEGQDLQRFAKGTASAKSFSLSFWVKAFQAGTYICELFDSDNTRQCSKSYTVNTSGTWEYKTITFPSDTTGVFNNDNGSSMSVNFWLAASSMFTSGTLNTSWGTSVLANRAVGQTNVASSTSNYFQITGVQLEQGSVATPFEHRPIQQELALCQRYYERITGIGSGSPDWAMIGSGGWDSTTNFSCTYVYKTTKRARPSVFSSPTGINCLYHGIAWYGSSSVGYSEISINAVRMNYTITGGSAVQGQAGVAVFATSSAYVEVSAEL